MFDDEKIPDENSMTKLANNYALHSVVKVNQVENKPNTTNSSNNPWQQYNALINSLSRLSNTVNRRDFRNYFGDLLTQNQQELQSVLGIYPSFDLSNSTNPIFNACPPPSIQNSLRNYLIEELRLIEVLVLLYSTEDDDDRELLIFNFINRHIQNIITLLSRSNIQ